MAYNFENKVAIVTGAGGGLGFEYAKYLALHGAKVVVNDLGGDPLGMDQDIDSSYAVQAANRIKEAGGEAIANKSSVSEWDAAKQIVEQAMDTWGRVDIIINNAGITSPAIFPEIDLAEMEQHHGVHVMGTLNTLRAAWPHMLKQKYGRIVNTSSSSTLGFVPQIAYPTMKGGVLGMTRNLALLGKDNGIYMNAIMPAAFTRMTGLLPDGTFRQKLEKEFSPDRLAPVIAYLCHENCDVNGECFSVGGGQFYRVVFAASETMKIDNTMESVAQSMGTVMNDQSPWKVIHDAFDDLGNLGFAEEEYDVFRDMTATQNSHLADAKVNAIEIKGIDDVWKITIKSPVGDQFSNLVLNSQGNNLIGNVLNEEHGAQKVIDGKIENGDTMTWTCKLSKPVPMTLNYSIQMDGEKKLGGNVKGKMMGKVVMDAAVTGILLQGAEAEEAKKQSAEAPEPKKGLLSRLFG
ncbi:MAG: SDR family NAD(P)-dependent oxidoreductase [Pseudomonadales bacterium]|nr:SDR family NAD(P)-dependent oxidoreductase [Pseudomonadales bacterium]